MLQPNHSSRLSFPHLLWLLCLLLAGGGLAALFSACGTPHGDDLASQRSALTPRTFALTHWNEYSFAAQDDEVYRWFSQKRGPVFWAPHNIVRLGLHWDASPATLIEARFATKDGPWSPWRRVRCTWSEQIVHVGHLDPPFLQARRAQVRYFGPAPSFFFVEGIDPQEMGQGVALAAPLPPAPPKKTLLPHLDPTKVGTSTQALSAPWFPRSSWGAQAPRCTPSDRKKYRITIHHTVTPNNDTVSPEVRMRGIQNYHRNTKRWCDIGYHAVISQDGRAWEGRPMTQLGTHVANANSGNFGISFMGNYTSVRPSSKMECAAAKIIDYLVKTLSISRNRTAIKGHRELGNSSCPGDALFKRLGAIVTLSNSAATCGSSPPPPPPGKGTLIGAVYEDPDMTKRIAGATVKLSTGQSATSRASDGIFKFSLAPGTYKITASKSGYKSASLTRTVTANQQTWGSVGLKKQPPPPPDTKPPVVKITSPADGSTVSQEKITIQGSATDDQGVASLTVQGKATPPDSQGKFSLSLTLSRGTNKIVAEAKDAAGNKGTASVTIQYQPGSEAPPTEPPPTEKPSTEPPPTEKPTPAEQPSPEPLPPEAPAPEKAQPEPALPDGGSTEQAPGESPSREKKVLVLTQPGQSCAAKADCPAGQTCKDGACVDTKVKPSGCGCHTPHNNTPSSPWSVLLCLFFLLFLRQRPQHNTANPK